MKLQQIFYNKNILVLGDVMIDTYIWGKVERISPEAPVPIVEVERRENRLGGAANVALNIKSLGGNAILASVIGRDDKSQIFLQLLKENELSSLGIIHSSDGRKTTTKFRIIGNNVQMLRVDEESTYDISYHDAKLFLDTIKSIFNTIRIDAVVFQDYDKGVLIPDIIKEVIYLSRQQGIPTLVDPKRKHFFDYQDVTLFKPNFKEFKEALNKPLTKKVEALIHDVLEFRRKQNIGQFLLTLGEDGMLLSYDQNGEVINKHIYSEAKQVADVSGAGDTVIATCALGLASRLDPLTTACLSNLAAGIVCEYVGVVPVPAEKFFLKASEYYGL
ncbi:MAG: bifunctional ADP-heptose synthase [Bacteroidales bacterium]|nr:bifunctional ADP-heptose synthase [Bacteroidales bacterium]